MKRIGRIAWTLYLIWASLCWVSAPTHAQEAIRIIASNASSQFGSGITFRVTAVSDQPINRIALYRQMDDRRVRARTELTFEPGTNVEATFDWELESGEVKPGAEITYHWLIENSAGQVWRSKPETIIYRDDRFDWQTLTQGRIELGYYDDTRARATAILTAAVEAAERLQDDMGIALESPVHIYVYNSSRDMALALSSRSEIYDARTVTLGVAIGGDTLLILGPHEDALFTVAHEMSHIVVGLATENPYTDMPRWLDEGLAMYAEGELPQDNARALDQAVRRDELISVQSLSGYVGNPEQVDLFYGQVYSIIDYMLQTYGQRKMTDLLTMLQQGVPIEQALAQIYGLTIDELDSAWRGSLGLSPRQDADQGTEQETGAQETPFCGAPAALGLVVAAAIAWNSKQHAPWSNERHA